MSKALTWRDYHWRDVTTSMLTTTAECDAAQHQLTKHIAEIEAAIELYPNNLKLRKARQYRHKLRHDINHHRVVLYKQENDTRRQAERERVAAIRGEKVAQGMARNAERSLNAAIISAAAKAERIRINNERNRSEDRMFYQIFKERYGIEAAMEIWKEVKNRLSREAETVKELEK